MNGWISIIGTGVTVLGVIVTAWLTYRGSRTAAAIQTEPNQRAADLATFKEIRDDMQGKLNETTAELRSLRSLARSLAGYVHELTAQMRGHGIEPPAPPDRVAEYNRTGV